jgi:branched-chain amino acid transport system ATP-binding protein
LESVPAKLADRVDSGPVLAVDAVSVRFGGVAALSNVTVDFLGDQVCGLIGPNGAGKTTLFDVLSGLRAPTSGIVRLDGADITHRSATWRSRQGIRRTFQRQQTFGWLSVEDNVLMALEWRGGGGGMLADLAGSPTRRRREIERRRRVADVLEVCGIAEVRKVPAGALPIGRARMVEMARAIVDPPKALLLDEPTSGLEQSEVEGLGQTIQRVRTAEGCAIVLVEHDVRFVMEQSSRIVVLNLGTLLADGPPEQIRDDKQVGAAYLG